MATCPHCGRELGAFGRTGMTPVRLGCGTLVIIAIIVAIFSQAGQDDLTRDVSGLRGTIATLKDSVASQNAEIRNLGEKIDSLLRIRSR